MKRMTRETVHLIDGGKLRKRVEQSTYILGVHYADEANGKPMVDRRAFIERERVFSIIDWMIENESEISCKQP